MDELERILAERATAKDSEKLIADLIADVAAAGGVATIDDLMAMGHTRAVLALAIEPEAQDKRTRPWLRCAVLGGTAVVWPTTKAWSQAGQPNRREAPPGSRTARHRLAPSLFNRWVGEANKLTQQQDILLSFDRGPGLRSVCEEMTQRAWGYMRQGGPLAQEASLLLTRPVPDALLVESWPEDSTAMNWREGALYPHLGCDERPGSELAVAVEVQFADSGTALLSQRLRAHDIAMRLGRGWHATLWVIDTDEVMERLTRAGVYDHGLHPGHYVVEAREVGLGDHTPLGTTNWGWPSAVGQMMGRH